MPRTVNKTAAPKAQKLFDDNEVYTAFETAERLKASHRQVRRWIDEGRFPEGGVIDLPRGRLVCGWALNEFLTARRR